MHERTDGIFREVLADSTHNAAGNGFSFIYFPIPSKPRQGGQVGAIRRGDLNHYNQINTHLSFHLTASLAHQLGVVD